jgi:hypothetical protein
LQARDNANASRNILLNPVGGNVGIGTTSPGVALHVDGDIRCDGVYGETDTNTSIQFPGSDVITFKEGGSEAARIDGSGRLLVGTPSYRSVGDSFSPRSVIFNEGSGLSTYQVFVGVHNRADTVGPLFVLGKTRGTTNGSVTIVQSGDILGQIRFVGADGVDLGSIAASIKAEVDGTPGANDMPGRLVFSTTADGSSLPTERLRINNSGAIGLSGANFGSAGQVLVSNGSSAAPSWEQITPTAVFGWDHDDDTYGLYLPGTSVKVSDLTGYC